MKLLKRKRANVVTNYGTLKPVRRRTATKKKPRKSLAGIKKLSTLLALGLADLKRQERSKNSVVDMNVWLKRNGECAACLGGSVMRFSLGLMAKKGLYLIPANGEEETLDSPDEYVVLDYATERRLQALDFLRMGAVPAAAGFMGLDATTESRDVPGYKSDRDGWWAAMKQLLRDLRRAGE